MHGKAQPVQSPQGKRAHSYRFLELPQVFAAVWSTSGGEWGERTVSGHRWEERVGSVTGHT